MNLFEYLTQDLPQKKEPEQMSFDFIYGKPIPTVFGKLDTAGTLTAESSIPYTITSTDGTLFGSLNSGTVKISEIIKSDISSSAKISVSSCWDVPLECSYTNED